MRRLLLLVAFAGCDATVKPAAPVSYRADVAPIFASRCVACHSAPHPTLLDLTAPFDATNGLVNRASSWTGLRHPVLVVPGKPEESGLIDKLSATDLDPHTEGAPMPFTVPAVTPAELAAIRQWIAGGALNDASYQANVAPIFGNALNLGRSIGKCSYCHTATSPNAPNLVDPFDPVRGAVNVAASVGGVRVVPGSPDTSVLVKKLTVPLESGVGASMPMTYGPVTAEELERIRTWIREGAKDN